MKEAIDGVTHSLDDLTEAIRKVHQAALRATEHLYDFSLELEVMLGRLPGNFGTIVRLDLSKRWVVAGRWLLEDDDVNLPKGLWGHLLSRMVRDVRAGRLLADPGF